ncbi:hypothetical protein NDU88_003278 [Pleurodeles waltl]|uniref:Uncharacterized protein n=1 Tax=Pleurodeles waltl TaxID=8319 RepID=A0AAV7QCB6_PLEWA|nr:hypothetical protein NDU88_003278 [Pleurodeles waltl]
MAHGRRRYNGTGCHGRWTYDTPVSAKSGGFSDARPTGSSDFYEAQGLRAGGVAVLGCSQKEYIWYKGDRCESYLTDLQLNGIIIGCCLLVSILLLLFPLLLMKATTKKPEKKPLGSTSRLWISSLMPHMNLSFSTLSDSSDATERTMFDTRPRWSTFLDVEKNQVSHDSNSWKKGRTTF